MRTNNIEKTRIEANHGDFYVKDRTLKETKERFPNTINGNYSLGVIDLDTNTFYYIKFDS